MRSDLRVSSSGTWITSSTQSVTQPWGRNPVRSLSPAHTLGEEVMQGAHVGGQESWGPVQHPVSHSASTRSLTDCQHVVRMSASELGDASIGRGFGDAALVRGPLSSAPSFLSPSSLYSMCLAQPTYTWPQWPDLFCSLICNRSGTSFLRFLMRVAIFSVKCELYLLWVKLSGQSNRFPSLGNICAFTIFLKGHFPSSS